MPPASPPSDQQNTTGDHSPLSDEDVGVLYEIITSAEQDSDVQAHPFRSIFTAYDTVLARYGLDPDHDQIYLRFLLRLGGKRQSGETLYQSFESLLAEFGIQIEINPQENEIQDVTRSVNATVDNSPELRTRSEAGSDADIRSRRASFHSFIPKEGKVIGGRRSSSRASVRGDQRNQFAQPRDRPSTRATTRPSERSDHRSSSSQHAPQPARGRLTAREFADNLQHYQRRHASASTTRNNLRRHLRAQSAHGPLVAPGEDVPSPSFESSIVTREEQRDKRGLSAQDRYTKDHEQAYRPDARELFYRPTETQLLRDADTFLHFRIRAVMRNAIRSWRNNALKAIKEHEGMASIAQAHDFETLLRQSFEQWRANLHQKVEAAATERYFAQLEQRAEKARDLHLLSKAFTHWQQIAREKVEYADEARRQVLRVKYFHAWLTLTVENNRKVQLHGERKFYNVWSERYLISLRNNEKASFTRARNLVKSDYWKWFWTFCERRAPQWRNRRLQSTIFNRWVLLGRENAYREYEVAVREQHIVKKKWFSKWLQHARAALSNSRAAEKIYQQKVAARSMLECRRQVRYAPLARQVSNMADWRIAGSTFAIFVNRYRTEQQAYKVNQLRIQRNAWTAWNDRLRWQTLESQIDDRVLVQALYRWVLAERAILLQRLCEQRLRRECLQKLIDHYRIRAIAQEAACGNMKRKRQARVLRLIIFRWRHALDVCRQNDQVAFDFEAPRVIQQTLSALSSKLDHARQLDKWAADGHYYFCTTRYLRQWRTTTAESRRRKLHEAYAHIRRQTKMKLANSCIRIWRDRTQHVGNMQEQAHLYSQTQILRFGTALFDHWRDRLAFILDREDQTTLEFDRRFAHKHLDTWASKYRTLTQLHELARVNVELRISNKWLHTLHLRIIELKGRESNAERIRRWYEKRHSHNILRRWREKTAKRRDQPLQPAVFSSARAVRRLAIRPQDAAAGQDNAVRADEEWTAFDEGGFDVGEWIPGLENVEASSTPLPGYLSTPSKRAARARGLVRMSTTPMGTPFAARLRSQLGKTPSKFGRSNVGIGGSAFGPIPESEPRTPDAS